MGKIQRCVAGYLRLLSPKGRPFTNNDHVYTEFQHADNSVCAAASLVRNHRRLRAGWCFTEQGVVTIMWDESVHFTACTTQQPLGGFTSDGGTRVAAIP